MAEKKTHYTPTTKGHTGQYFAFHIFYFTFSEIQPFSLEDLY